MAKKTWQGYIVNQTRTLTPLYHYTTVVPIMDNKDEIIEFIGIIQDLTELHKKNEEHAQNNISQAMELKDSDLLKNIPFPSALISNELVFSAYNKPLGDTQPC